MNKLQTGTRLSRLHLPFLVRSVLVLFSALSAAGAAETVLTSGKTMVRTDKDNVDEVARFMELRRKLTESDFIVRNGELTRRSPSAATSSSAMGIDNARNIADIGLAAVRGKLNIPEGASVIVVEGANQYDVIIGNPPQVGVRGPDYTAKVSIDKGSRAVIQVLAGG